MLDNYVSRPLYEGVDWNAKALSDKGINEVALFTRAWIEIDGTKPFDYVYEQSPSLRGRGLKSTAAGTVSVTAQSPSLRGRGLKFYLFHGVIKSSGVALFTRAWIEIGTVLFSLKLLTSRPLYEGVDWNVCP